MMRDPHDDDDDDEISVAVPQSLAWPSLNPTLLTFPQAAGVERRA